jgi:hypothetical protein
MLLKEAAVSAGPIRIGCHFPEHTARGSGIDEGSLASTWTAVRLRLARTQAPRRQFSHSLRDVIDKPAEMMQPFTMLIEVRAQGMIRTKRLDELQMQVAEVQMCQAHSGFGNDLAQDQRQFQDIAIKPERIFGIAHNNGNMIQFLKHAGRMKQRSVSLKPRACLPIRWPS